MRYLRPSDLAVVPVLIETVDGTAHVAARVTFADGHAGPLLTAEGCNLDDASGEVVRELDVKSAIVDAALCQRCAIGAPVEVG